MKSLSDGATIALDLDGIAAAISDYPFIGVNSNQDPCFASHEDGFENIIYDPLTDEMVWGYTVIITRVSFQVKPLLDKAALCVLVHFLEKDFNSSGEASRLFHLETEIAEIQEWIAETVVTWSKENV